MKILAFNGSPRKEWNTATLLKKSLEGAASCGADVELVHLYDLSYKGCTSCFACKLKGGKSYGHCAMSDGLTPFLNKVEQADAIILGSPVYLSEVTGEMRSFLERLIFPYFTYTNPPMSLFGRRIPTGFIYTFGATEDVLREKGILSHLAIVENFLSLLFGPTLILRTYDNYQFDDYSKYVSSRFDPVMKAKRQKEVFPADCARAFSLGQRIVSQDINNPGGEL